MWKRVTICLALSTKNPEMFSLHARRTKLPLPTEFGQNKKKKDKNRTQNRIRSPRRPVPCLWINAIKGSRQRCCVSSVDTMALKIGLSWGKKTDIRFPAHPRKSHK